MEISDITLDPTLSSAGARGIFFTGSYKPPREFNWVVGVLLLLLTLLLSFTGYLLPWDQLAVWAIAIQLVAIAVSLWRRTAPFAWQTNPIALNIGMMGVIEVADSVRPDTAGRFKLSVTDGVGSNLMAR